MLLKLGSHHLLKTIILPALNWDEWPPIWLEFVVKCPEEDDLGRLVVNLCSTHLTNRNESFPVIHKYLPSLVDTQCLTMLGAGGLPVLDKYDTAERSGAVFAQGSIVTGNSRSSLWGL